MLKAVTAAANVKGSKVVVVLVNGGPVRSTTIDSQSDPPFASGTDR
jgi:hypothetical protein